jgi:hypothetical protein
VQTHRLFHVQSSSKPVASNLCVGAETMHMTKPDTTSDHGALAILVIRRRERLYG